MGEKYWVSEVISELDPSFNLLEAKFFRESIDMYLHFMLILHINMTQVVEILPHVRQGSTYST